MEKKSFELPAMYADHHVVEVRRILLETPGVEDVYASSAFQVAEVTYDPDTTSESAIAQKLEEAGYLGDFVVTAEAGKPAISKTGMASSSAIQRFTNTPKRRSVSPKM